MAEMIAKLAAYAVFALIVAAPLLAALVTVFAKARARRASAKAPVSEKLLRPPGHTLRSELESFDDVMVDTVLKLLMIGAGLLLIFGLLVRLVPSGGGILAMLAVVLVLTAAVSVVVVRKVAAGVQRYWNNALGYRGELCAGQELNQLLREGCFVFHDVPGDGSWNIDHVVVAPTGVFAIETKTRRKPLSVPGRKNYEVVFDGKSLEFPTWRDTHGIDQAKANARWLAKFLSGALAEPVKVTPVLTLPGWFVSSRVGLADAGILVLALKALRKVLLDRRGSSLTDRQMEQIAHQLDQRCRDVEF
jgi:hypothetical protein